MSLTGLPLLVSVGFAAIIAAAATVAGWRRFGRYRFLPRVVGILLTEAMVLVTVGLAVNRSQQFYPSWEALVHRTATIRDPPATPGNLDRWLSSRQGGAKGQPTAFAWRPSGWVTWHLTAPPTVVVPVGYLQHPSWRYPVVLVATGAHDGWGDADEASAAQWAQSVAGPVVLVFTRIGPSVTAGTLATTLPHDLMADLRVSRHSWAIVASAAEGALAHQAVLTQPGQFPALALVPTQPRRQLRHAAQQPGGSVQDATAGQTPPRHGSPLVGLPVGETLAVILAPGGAARPSTGNPVYLVAEPVAALRTALCWAGQQAPAPLAAATSLIPPTPVRSHTGARVHAHRSTPPSAAASER